MQLTPVFQSMALMYRAEPHNVYDLKKGDRWFDPRQSFRELMIVIATGFIDLLPLSIVLMIVMWENGLERILCTAGKHR